MSIRTVGALIVGVAIIVIAVVFANKPISSATSAVEVVDAPTRNYIESPDSNGDGIKDWEEQFISLHENTTTTPFGGNTEYIPPETVTGQFAESFFQDYMTGTMDGFITENNQEQFIGATVESLEVRTRDKILTYRDIVIGNDDPLSIRDYGNAVAKAAVRNSIQNENEMDIFQRAVQMNDQAALAELEPIIVAYEGMFDDTKAIPAPPSLRKEHVDLLNVYQALIGDLKAMRNTYNDPLLSLIRFKRYPDDARALFYSYRNIISTLKTKDVVYAEDEYGSFYYLFDTGV